MTIKYPLADHTQKGFLAGRRHVPPLISVSENSMKKRPDRKAIIASLPENCTGVCEGMQILSESYVHFSVNKLGNPSLIH